MIASLLLAAATLLLGGAESEPAFQPLPAGDSEVAVPAKHLNLGETVRNDDYPLEAPRRNETGIATFILSINDRGLVTDCRIETTSGSTELDGQTCRLYSERGRFEPAYDKSGRKIASSLRLRIRWNIPEPNLPPLADYHARTTVTLAKDGSISRCHFEIISVAINVDQECSKDPRLEASLIAQFKDAVTLRGKTAIQETYLIVDDKPLTQFGKGPGETITDRSAIEITVGSDGKPIDCWVIERSDDDGSGGDPCGNLKNILFGQLPVGDIRTFPLKVRRLSGTYIRP